MTSMIVWRTVAILSGIGLVAWLAWICALVASRGAVAAAGDWRTSIGTPIAVTAYLAIYRLESARGK